MTDLPDTSPNLGLPFYQTKLNEFEVQHNEALLMLDALVMLAVKDRDLSAPPSSPALGDRYLVKPTGTGDFADNDNRIAQYDTGGWNFYAPQVGWTCYVQDEKVLLAWNGTSWAAAFDVLGSISEIQNLSLLGIGATADSTNPLSAKLNNVLWAAKPVADGGDGSLRYKMSKESAATTLSLLFQDNFSGRAEIGLAGDDDLHFKTSADGSTWTDALILDRTTGAAKFNSAFFLTGDLTPSQITADQNDYNPSGLSTAGVLRLSTDVSRSITGLSGGGDGRVVALVNAGGNPVVLKDSNASSSAGNRFVFGADVTLVAKQSAVVWYDATDARWRLLAGPQASGGGGSGPADLDITLAELELGLADAMNVAQLAGSAGNRFADSFDALTYVDVAGATNLDSATAGQLKPTMAGSTQTIAAFSTVNLDISGVTIVCRNTPLTASDSILAIGAYSTAARTCSVKIAKRNSASNYDIVVSESFSHPGGGWADHTLATPYVVPGTGEYDVAAFSATTWTDNTASVSRAYKLSSDATGTGVAFTAEDSYVALPLRVVKTGATNDMTVKSAALTAAAAPTSMKIVALVEEVDAITLNTDLVFAASRDGGTTFSSASMTDRFVSGPIHVLESAAIDVSAQPSGTSVKWKATTANNKMVRIHGVYLYWS